MTERNDPRRRGESVTVDPDGGYHYEADEDESLSEAVVSSVSAVRGVDPTEIEPLYYVLDPDGLDALFGPKLVGGRRPEARLEFAYAGCEVTVFPGGRVLVEESDPPPR